MRRGEGAVSWDGCSGMRGGCGSPLVGRPAGFIGRHIVRLYFPFTPPDSPIAALTFPFSLRRSSRGEPERRVPFNLTALPRWRGNDRHVGKVEDRLRVPVGGIIRAGGCGALGSMVSQGTGAAADRRGDPGGRCRAVVQGGGGGRTGGTILLADGRYMMPRYLGITTDNVTLRSESGDRDKVILDGAVEPRTGNWSGSPAARA